MTDLIKRLRSYDEEYLSGAPPCVHRDCKAAADRLETLEAALVRLEAVCANVSASARKVGEALSLASADAYRAWDAKEKI
jgi:hypothetical protein